MTRIRVTIPWGCASCHPAFLVTFDVTLNLYPEDPGPAIPETYPVAVVRLKPDGTPDRQLVPVSMFERVMGREAFDDLCDAALEAAKDAEATAKACTAIVMGGES